MMGHQNTSCILDDIASYDRGKWASTAERGSSINKTLVSAEYNARARDTRHAQILGSGSVGKRRGIRIPYLQYWARVNGPPIPVLLWVFSL